MATIDTRVDEAQLRRNVAAARLPSAAQWDRVEVRLLAAYVTGRAINDLWGYIVYVLHIDTSVLHKVASLPPGAKAVGIFFCLAAVLLVPHFVSLVFFPRRLSVRWPRKLALMGAVVACLTWFHLANQARAIDVGGLAWTYFRYAFADLALAAIYGVSLNAQIARALHDWFFHSQKP